MVYVYFDSDSETSDIDVLEEQDAPPLGEQDQEEIEEETSVQQHTHVLICPDHSILSRYVHNHSDNLDIETGYITDGSYVTPLHIPALIVGHTHTRIGVYTSSTTKLSLPVTVSYHVNPVFNIQPIKPVGSLCLAKYITYIRNSMNVDDLCPSGFAYTTRLDGIDDAPLTLGYSSSVAKYQSYHISYYDKSKSYVVPVSCPSKRYRSPCGLGSTMVSNSIVLMYPDVNQYLVDTLYREPKKEHVGFLCVCSSSSSAALKGLVRYACSGTVCRCYNMGIDSVLKEIHDTLLETGCKCKTAGVWIHIAGLQCMLCDTCVVKKRRY